MLFLKLFLLGIRLFSALNKTKSVCSCCLFYCVYTYVRILYILCQIQMDIENIAVLEIWWEAVNLPLPVKPPAVSSGPVEAMWLSRWAPYTECCIWPVCVCVCVFACTCVCVCMYMQWMWDKLFSAEKLNFILLIIKVILRKFLVDESILKKFHSELGMKKQAEFLLSSNFHEKLNLWTLGYSFQWSFYFAICKGNSLS